MCCLLDIDIRPTVLIPPEGKVDRAWVSDRLLAWSQFVYPIHSDVFSTCFSILALARTCSHFWKREKVSAFHYLYISTVYHNGSPSLRCVGLLLTYLDVSYFLLTGLLYFKCISLWKSSDLVSTMNGAPVINYTDPEYRNIKKKLIIMFVTAKTLALIIICVTLVDLWGTHSPV